MEEDQAAALVSQAGTEPETQTWWNSLSEEERWLAEDEARQYAALSESEQERLWNEEAESVAVDAEGDEIELSAPERTAR